MSEAPNPGSDAAIQQGCICPVMDNHHGKGWRGQEGIFLQTAGCKVHPLPDATFDIVEKQSA